MREVLLQQDIFRHRVTFPFSWVQPLRVVLSLMVGFYLNNSSNDMPREKSVSWSETLKPVPSIPLSLLPSLPAYLLCAGQVLLSQP